MVSKQTIICAALLRGSEGCPGMSNGAESLPCLKRFNDPINCRTIEPLAVKGRGGFMVKQKNGPQRCPHPNPLSLVICYIACPKGIKAANRIKVANH